MEKPATDIYTFEVLRTGAYTYVDKTAQILRLANDSIGRQFFLARPRRFGKSLLVSTLHALFDGRKDLFRGLAIEDKWDWTQRWPVLHLDMGSCQGRTVAATWSAIDAMLQSESSRLKVPLHGNDGPSNFRFFIEDLAERSPSGQMVLLVDEYDKPLLNHLGDADVNEYRDLLKQFYSVIKTLESKQRFTFITGVSKFSKVSIFSDLNNLKDRTMTSSEATILGYTHDELKRFFPETLQKIADVNGLDAEGAFNLVVKWYDGYRFEENAEEVINPVSFGLCSEEGKFRTYWANTATPTFLIDALKKQPLDFSTIDITEAMLEAYEPANPQLVTLLYQTGYLTIKNFKQIGNQRKYELGFPNYEVADSFLSSLAPVYAGLDMGRATNYQLLAQESIVTGDVERFIKALKSFFANIPYSLTDRQNEQMWQTIVYVVLKAIGVAVSAEVQTNDGRIDMVCEAPDAIWLIEFKLDHTAQEALDQIDENDYAAKYDFTGKKVVKIGVAFSSEQRTITEVKLECC